MLLHRTYAAASQAHSPLLRTPIVQRAKCFYEWEEKISSILRIYYLMDDFIFTRISAPQTSISDMDVKGRYEGKCEIIHEIIYLSHNVLQLISSRSSLVADYKKKNFSKKD